MARDRHAHPMTHTGAEAVRHYEKALDNLLFFREETATEAEATLDASPRSAMGNVLRAYLGLLGTEEKDAAEAATAFAAYRKDVTVTELTPRERLHVEAASSWLGGDFHEAGRLLAELVVAHPKDALALAVGHQTDFFTGNAVLLRDRIGGALSAWDEHDPHYGLLQGMYAFGLEEAGHYTRAEHMGLEAVARNPRDVWGIHAVVHSYEMQGRYEDGIRFLDTRTGDWTTGNYLTVHNWWHYALYVLETGRTDDVLAVYDTALHHDGSTGAAMELLDAAALLWRLYLAGTGTGDRWPALADAWAARHDGPHYAFNDVHAVMAYVGAGRLSDAERLIHDRRTWLEGAGAGTGVSNVAMTAAIGLPVCRALVAYGRGRYADTVDTLLPLRRRFQDFGGSHAQRDALQKTLVEAALRAGHHDLARTLLSERAGLRPQCPYDIKARARLARATAAAPAAAPASAPIR
ncbi:tetratricopeptide repeat protein [Streptomyces sp. UNOB3_S3]|uniref:tetratricopeptide repeat protein n=1 Tax=Streptomyces sp. UNOB3_S3 TaxID=2871682 RepID=UPI001E4CE807|nr:tetratricopeptide repeat protein [Streptomyces sp. UNOB3_S3]MCC3778591.1 tetratricopeptide repeat protein [Streptomyces sp. UNOB3_S3]